MAKDEDKAGGKVAPAAKPPLFSKAGLMVLLAGCLVSGGIPTVWLWGRSPAGTAHPGQPSQPMPGNPGGGNDFRLPRVNNRVALEPLQVNYRDSAQGGPRRTLNVTVVLEILTEDDPEHSDPEFKKRDDRRKEAVQKLMDPIRDKLFTILRGKGPEDFATNELIDQVKQQIRHAINDEKFNRQDVVQNVLFTEQRF
jgi:hypothetical protein